MATVLYSRYWPMNLRSEVMRVSKLQKQIEIEHKKLKIKHFVSTALFILFALMTLASTLVISALARWAGDDFKSKMIGILISFLYFAITFSLTLLFQNISFYSKDDLEIAGWTENYETVYKYKSEIMAEEKLRERGFWNEHD